MHTKSKLTIALGALAFVFAGVELSPTMIDAKQQDEALVLVGPKELTPQIAHEHFAALPDLSTIETRGADISR